MPTYITVLILITEQKLNEKKWWRFHLHAPFSTDARSLSYAVHCIQQVSSCTHSSQHISGAEYSLNCQCGSRDNLATTMKRNLHWIVTHVATATHGTLQQADSSSAEHYVLTLWSLARTNEGELREWTLQRWLAVTLTSLICRLNVELNPICHLITLRGGATIVVVGGLRVKLRA
jgi:hypothetical protein